LLGIEKRSFYTHAKNADSYVLVYLF